ncbi:AzlD family protein [Azorhizobium caulinodans]|nr:AzlD domain-containing protein [Azorhizobium caulinodans]
MTSVDPQTVLAIVVMALATAFNRASGFFLMRLIPLTPRVRKIIDCLPGAVLVALIAPTVAHGDLAMAAGLAAAYVVTKITRSDFIAVLAAMAVGVGIRAWMG